MEFAFVSSENQFVNGNDPFSDLSVLQAYAEANQAELCILKALDGDNFLAWMPVFLKKKANIPVAITPPLLPYIPIVFPGSDDGSANAKQWSHVEIMQGFSGKLQDSCRRLLINLPTGITDVRGFQWSGFSAIPRYTYVYSLKEGVRYQRLKYRDIKRAGELDPEMVEEKNIPLFLALKEETYQKQSKRFPYNDVIHQELLEKLFATGFLRQFTVRCNGRDVSTQLIYEGKKTVYTWQGFTNRDFLREGITTWINDSLIRHYRPTHESFDFCGANIPDIAKYKSGFGGELTPYYQLQWTDSPLLESLLDHTKNLTGLRKKLFS